jgi:hypothetical protein
MSLNAASRTAQPSLFVAASRWAAVMQAWTPAIRTTAPEIATVRVLHLALFAAIMAIGGFLRFWGLGDIGLHGDEETMALAVSGLLEQGAPILPSGMFYPRGMTQLYLMAASVSIFGESEWALRLPSALCGIVLIGVCYFVGRRFLRAEWNLAFVASIALLPELIEYSQTARMYIFFVTCIAATMALVFVWERTDRAHWLAAATAMLILGMDMQVLAVSAAFVFLIPGLVHSDMRRLLQGALASAVTIIAFVVINSLVEAQYPVPPPEFTSSLPASPVVGSDVPRDFSLVGTAILWSLFAVLAFLSWCVAKTQHAKFGVLAGVLLITAGLLQLALFYHLAALFYLAGFACSLRHGSLATRHWLVALIVCAAVIAATHAILLAPGAGTPTRLVGAMVGQPSVWPYVRVAQLSIAAGFICGALLMWGVYQLAHGRTVPDYWLLAVFVVWAPVFALGLFAWNVPPRYTAVALIPMVVTAFATLQAGIDALVRRRRYSARRAGGIAAAIAAVCVINPVQAANTIHAGYRTHPDHKGTAEYLKSQGLNENDIVLAEDVLQQTYYLGSVDYWLIGPAVARKFVTSRNGEVVDFYTGTPVIVSEAMLDFVLLENPDKRIFVIVSGEERYNDRLHARGPELYAAINSKRFETVYVGRDGVSKVLRVVPNAVSEIVAERQRTGPSADVMQRSPSEAPSKPE